MLRFLWRGSCPRWNPGAGRVVRFSWMTIAPTLLSHWLVASVELTSEQMFCSKCGSAIAAGSAFCSKCGAPVTSTAQAPQAQLSWREQRRMERRERRMHEKQEKGEKAEKGEKQEKGGGSMAGPLVGGSVLIWLGISVYLERIGVFSSNIWPAYFLVGLGLILVADGLVRSLQRDRAYFGLLIGGAVLVLVGATIIQSSWENLWPLLLVLLGVAVIVGGLTARRRSPTP
jgi:hypothetical protein